MCTDPAQTDLSRYVVNNLYDRNFFVHELPGHLAPIETAAELFPKIKAVFDQDEIRALNEPQLEDRVIKPVLALLGWFPLPQEVKVVQGKQLKPDWSLFATREAQDAYLAVGKEERKQTLEGIVAFCESKAADQELDTKKADKRDNPYIQLLEYLNYTRLPYGFLSNGREWWLVDNSRVSSDKRYLRINLEQILVDGDQEAFRYFHYFFQCGTFLHREEDKPAIAVLADREAQARMEVENDLRSVVYGTDGRDSLFERIGQALFNATGRDTSPSHLRDVFENSLYLVFRLLFIAFFEDKYEEQLAVHPSYREVSLKRLSEGLAEAAFPYWGWHNLKLLFSILDEGSGDLGIPLLNGGLFDKARATLLNKPKVMDNDLLRQVLDDLFTYRGGLLRRDYRTLSVTHLGAIYEGLLEFEFRVAEEPLTYLEYRVRERDGAKVHEGYFDTYDAEALRQSANTTISVERQYPKDALYLVGTQNSRKASGSYYTPSELSFPLVRRAIDHQLDKVGSVLELRVLDNACGSGHLLIEALNYLTRKALERLDQDAALRSQLAGEKEKIQETVREFGLVVDEFAVLKRLLLKQVIYGVDMQPFAIELAHLALWIDTFVFGTPLSFIGHHVKVGNSLIGTGFARFRKFLAPDGQGNLLLDELSERFGKLREVYRKLSAIRDTTAEEVRQSNTLYKNEIRPILAQMDRAMDLLNFREMLEYEGDREEADKIKFDANLVRKVLDGSDPLLLIKLAEYKERYRFFNWELEFPEAFANGNGRGFHVIVGNPPWDKTKFLDPDFFSQYRSNYRTMTNRQKAEVRVNLLDIVEIRNRYDKGKAWVKAVNEYYKSRYPLNSGSGDGNLFRFFVERNLALLLHGGALNYVLPTALLTEEGSDTLRKHIFENYWIARFDGLENREKIFPDVDSRYKFGLLQVERTKDVGQAATMRFMLTDPAALATEEGCFPYSLDDLRVTSPDHMAFMEVAGGRKDLDILRRLYSLFKPLDPQWLDFRNELHATNDKAIFIETDRPEGLLPLYKGAMIWQYDSCYAQPEYWLDPKVFDEYLHETEISRLVKDVYPSIAKPQGKTQVESVLMALGLKSKEELGRFVRPDRDYYRLGFRDIARDTDERTLIASLLPKNIGAQNKVWVSIPKNYVLGRKKIILESIPNQRILFSQAVFNAVTVDWVLRFMIAITVNKTYLMRLPLPQPTDEELETNQAYRELVFNSLRLSLHFNPEGFAELKEEFGLKDKDIPHTAKQVDMLKIRNDCLVATLYQVTPDELTHMLASFKVLNSKHPEYVQALLAAYRAMHGDN